CHDRFTYGATCPTRNRSGCVQAEVPHIRCHPIPTFDATQSLDRLRATEYARLDAQQHVYLDYTGGGLYAECQVREHLELLCSHVFGNPHSTNPASQAMTTLVDRARRFVLSYFHASLEEYVVIFTPNASGALK